MAESPNESSDRGPIAKPNTMVMAVFTSIIAAYPFYGIITKLSKPDLETFVPCNDRPCNFQRLFTGSGVPGTAPDVLAVQNGVARPLVMTDEFHAIPVEYDVVQARILPRTPLGLLGINDYVWPCVGEKCASAMYHMVQYCICGVCLDDHWGLSFGMTLGTWDNYWLLQSQRTEHATRRVHHFRRNQSNQTTYSLQTETLLWSNKGLQVFYEVVASFVNLYSGVVLSIFGESRVSGSESLLDGLCPNVTQQEMNNMCASEGMKKLVRSDMSHGRCAVVYTSCLILWVLLKSMHDLMLLNGCDENLSLHCGLLCIPVQGAAAASSVLLFIAACEIFVAQVPNQPCQCYYKMRDWDALLFLATPFVLVMIYYAKVQTVNLSLLVGDVLHYRSFDIPFRLVKNHERWPENGLMQPIVRGHAAEPELLCKESGVPSFSLLVCLFVLKRATSSGIHTMTFLVWGVFVAKVLMLLTTVSLEAQPQLGLPAKLCLCGPALVSVIWVSHRIGSRAYLGTLGAWNPSWQALCFVLCLMPALDAMTGRHPAEVDLLWCSTRWTMSGGLWATLMLRFAFWEIKGAYKIENSLTACLCSYLPPLQYKLVHRFLLGALGKRRHFLLAGCVYLPDAAKRKLLDGLPGYQLMTTTDSDAENQDESQ